MIVAIILITIFSLVVILLGTISSLPDATLPTGIATAFSTLGGYYAVLDQFLPLVTILSVLAAFLVVETAIFTYKGGMWSIKRLWK